MRFQILFSSLFIKIVAFAVNNDYKGHIFYVKLTESFCAQILVCDKLRFFDTFGKGARLPEVVEAMKKYHGVYFGAIGGAGALLAKCIKKAELIAYEDLGAEALRKLYVEDMPLVVIIDSEGNNLYEEGRKEYLEAHKEN